MLLLIVIGGAAHAVCPPGPGEICYGGANYATIQLAIAACPPGGTITLGAGDINVTGPAYMYGETIVGQGEGVTIVKFSASAYGFAPYTNTSAYESSIQDMSIESNTTSGVIYLQDPIGFVMKNVSAVALSSLVSAYVIRQPSYDLGDIEIDNCYLEGPAWVGSFSTLRTTGSKVRITNSFITSRGETAYSSVLSFGNNISADVRDSTLTHLGTSGSNYAVNLQNPGTVATVTDMTQTFLNNTVNMSYGLGMILWQTFPPATGQDASILVQNNDLEVGGIWEVIATRRVVGDATSIRILDNKITGQAVAPLYGISAIFGGDVEIRRNEVKNILHASTSSAAIYCANPANVVVSDNAVTNSSQTGISVSNATETSSATIERNRVSQCGRHGIYLLSNVAGQPRGLIANNIVDAAANTGIYGTGTIDIVNNTLVNGGAYDMIGSATTCVAANNILHNGGAAWIGISVGSRFNNIVNTPAGAGPDPLLGPAPTYELLASSPALDAGDATYGALAGAADNDGHARVVGSAIDIGAQERQCAECGSFTGIFETTACNALTDGAMPTALSAAIAEVRAALVALYVDDGCNTLPQFEACVDAWLATLP